MPSLRDQRQRVRPQPKHQRRRNIKRRQPQRHLQYPLHRTLRLRRLRHTSSVERSHRISCASAAPLAPRADVRPRPSADAASARSTTSLACPHRRSASAQGLTAARAPARSSSAGPAARTLRRSIAQSASPTAREYAMSHAAITSIRQVEAVTGVTVVSELNHRSLPRAFTARIVSYLRFGSTKSIVVTGLPSSRYGAEFELGAWALIRKPAFLPWFSLSFNGSNFFVFSWMLAALRHHHARCTNGPCAGSISPMMP